MKQILFTALAVAATVGFTACSSEQPLGPNGDGTGNVTIVANLPSGLDTRAFSDGTTAQTLHYYVYESGETTPVISDSKEINISTTLTLSLVNGQTYDFVFWAQSDATDAYTYDPATRTVTVSYAGATQNDESRDAFYNVKTLTITGGTTETVELFRPFAQVNFGTGDANETSVKSIYGDDLGNLTTSLLVATKVPNTLDLMTGAVSGEELVTFGQTAIPASTETFPAGQPAGNPLAAYRYVAMDYILCGAERSVADLSLDIYNGQTLMNTIDVPNAPVQANYQTNIYGNLLTSSTNFNIIIRPAFAGSEDIELWDGSAETPDVDDTAKTVTINNAAQLAGFAQLVNNGNSFNGYTATLTADVDLNGTPWEPIGSSSSNNGNRFQGTFDGQGHTVTGLNIKFEGTSKAAGLFGTLNGTVKDLNIDGAYISLSSESESGIGAGAIAGKIFNSGLITGCSVSNSTIEGDHYVGSVCGYAYGNIQNCTATDNTVSATLSESTELNDKVGGIIGYCGEGNYTYSGNTVTGCTLVGYRNVGGIAGSVQSGVTVSGNTVKDTNITYTCPNGTTGSTSDKYSNGEVVGRPINATVKDNTVDNVTITGANTISGYPGLIKDEEGNVHVGSPAALASLAKFVTEYKGAFNENMVLDADIDAAGMTWTAKFRSGTHLFSFDGQGHTISNLNIEHGMFTGACGGQSNPTIIKDVTFDRCTVTGDWGAGTVLAYFYGCAELTNVHVINSTVTAAAQVGGLVGALGEGNGSNYGVTFTNCSVENTTITATGHENCKAGASQFMGFVDYFMANETNKAGVNGVKYIKFGEGNSVAGNTVKNAAGMLGGGIYTIGWIKNENGVSNITFDLTAVDTFTDDSVTEP